MACKNKWWPHNWLCLRGLYWVFVAIFYIILAITVYQLGNSIVYIFRTWNNPMVDTGAHWLGLLGFLIAAVSYMLIPLTVAVILKTLRKIKGAVAPCCCEARHEEAAVQATVTSTEEEKKQTVEEGGALRAAFFCL